MFHQQKNKTMEQLDVRITNTPVRCQLESVTPKHIKRDLLFTSCKYFEVKNYAKESRVDLDYEKILDKAKVQNSL